MSDVQGVEVTPERLAEMLDAPAVIRVTDTPAPLPPSPDTVALAIMSAMISSGRHESAQAAIMAAWAEVPHFYLGREYYVEKIAPMFFMSVDREP